MYYITVFCIYFSLLLIFFFFCWQVDKHRDHLINYIIFLRITPFLPNWFINITSPVINVPLGVFFIGTFLGKTVCPLLIYVILMLFVVSCSPVFYLFDRSGTTILCSHQRWYNTVQTDHSRWGRVLELPGRAGRPGRALHFARLLPEEAAAEARVEHCKHLRTSSADWSHHPLPSAQERAAVAQVAAGAGVVPVGEPLTTGTISTHWPQNACSGRLFLTLSKV